MDYCANGWCPETHETCRWSDEYQKCTDCYPFDLQCEDIHSPDECFATPCPNNPTMNCQVVSVGNNLRCTCPKQCQTIETAEECKYARQKKFVSLILSTVIASVLITTTLHVFGILMLAVNVALPKLALFIQTQKPALKHYVLAVLFIVCK